MYWRVPRVNSAPAVPRRFDPSLVLLLVCAAALRVWGIGYGLPHTLTRPDEEAVLGVALRIFGRNLNPGFFDWPSLFIYAVAAAYVVYFNVGRVVGWFGREASFIAAGTSHPAPLFLIARGVSAAAGTATVATVYRVGVQLFDRTTALVAAAFLVVAALHARESHFGLTDISATWLLMTSFLYTVTYSHRHVRRHALIAAFFAGLAASTKYNAMVVMLPLLWAVARQAEAAREANRLRLSVMCLFIALAAFVVGTPYAVLDPVPFLTALREVSAHLRRGHMALAGYAWRIHLTSSLRYGLGLPMLLAGIGGMALFLSRHRRDGVLFLLCPLTYFALIGAGQSAFARYILPTIPFLCLAAAYLVVDIARVAGTLVSKPCAVTALIWIIAALVAAPSMSAAIETDRLLTRTDNRLLAAAWLRERFPAGASLCQTGSVYGHVQMQGEGFVPDPRYPETGVDATPPPDVLVVLRCPLAYCDVPAHVNDVLRSYTPLRSFDAVDIADPDLVYDRDDAFFVPLSGFGAVTRPGPNLEIYKRVGVR